MATVRTVQETTRNVWVHLSNAVDDSKDVLTEMARGELGRRSVTAFHSITVTRNGFSGSAMVVFHKVDPES